jgi:hypothetical protein
MIVFTQGIIRIEIKDFTHEKYYYVKNSVKEGKQMI